MNWQKQLKHKKLDYLKETIPEFFEKNGGYNMLMHDYCGKSELGIIRAVNDWINYNGGTAVSKGHLLSHAVIEGKNVFIRPKPGWAKLNDEQEAERIKITKGGSIYCVVRDMEIFIDWFNKFVIRLKKQAADAHT